MNNTYIGTIAGILVGLAIGYFLFHVVTVTRVGTIGDQYIAPASISVQGDATGATLGYISADNKYQWASVANNSGRDRFINSIEYGAIGLVTVSTSTTSVIPLTIATSTTAALGLNGNTNYVQNGNAIATSSNWYFQTGTSTPYGSVSTFATGVTRVWPTGTVLNVESTATSSANFWIKINYLPQ
jgi:hypothetical protein